MNAFELSTVILSDLDHDHLVAEISAGDQFLCLLDRELGRNNVRIAFPRSDGTVGEKILLAEFVAYLHAAADNLRN